MRVVVSAGGTGGHIYPALAIIKKIKEKEPKSEILYIGTHNRMEKDIVPEQGIKYIGIEIYGFMKSKMGRNIKNIGMIYKSYRQCKKILDDFKPDVVLGIGGYVTYPVIKAAKSLNIKTFIHEQNSIPGRSNQALAKYADIVGISFPNTSKYFKNSNVVLTGNPCNETAVEVKKINKKDLGLSNSKKLVLVVAGSLGSQSLNDRMINFLNLASKEKFEVLYVTGNANYEEFINAQKFAKNIKIVPYVNNLPGLMKVSDLMITRAGATTISEILALKVPSIFIPSPNVANNHQYYNALELKEANAAELILESEIDEKILLDLVKEILTNKEKTLFMKKQLEKLSINNSATIIYETLKDMIIW